jgi:type IV pilus assembly protein PilB
MSKMKFFHGKGCAKCSNLGFKGRIGIYEVLVMSPEIEKVILSGNVSEYQMRELAQKAGMITMAQDGVLKALDGFTTLDEVFRVAE